MSLLLCTFLLAQLTIGEIASPNESCETIWKTFEVPINSSQLLTVRFTAEPYPGESDSASAGLNILTVSDCVLNRRVPL